MAARVLLGKSTNSNLGHGSGKFGLYISRNGDDVTSCTKDQLVFNTDDVGNNSGAVDLGQFQVLPVSGTSASVNTSVGAGATATVNFTNQTYTGNVVFTQFAAAHGGAQNVAILNQTFRISYSGASSGTIVNLGNTAFTAPISIFKGFSTSGLF